ncbi:borealin-2 [Engraulis encrasicolus]|uniref:borealin-2 n=1 Tax=Engraulis encrasicolus TaxID=184585 RepID=UPI002FD76172
MPRRRKSNRVTGQAEQASPWQLKQRELFIQQVEKEAAGRLKEMEAKTQKMLSSVDRSFKILTMTTPQAQLNTLFKDMMGCRDADVPVGDVTIALEAQSPEIHKPLSRKSSKKAVKAEPASSPKRRKNSQRRAKSRTRSPEPTESKPLRSARTTAGSVRTVGRVLRSGGAPATGLKAKPISRSMSDSSLKTATFAMVVKTSQGESVIIEKEEDFDAAKLDQEAVLHMKQLRDLMIKLCHALDLDTKI